MSEPEVKTIGLFAVRISDAVPAGAIFMVSEVEGKVDVVVMTGIDDPTP